MIINTVQYDRKHKTRKSLKFEVTFVDIQVVYGFAW